MSRNLVPESHDPARRGLLRGAVLILGLVITGTRGLFARVQTENEATTRAHVEDTLARLARHLFPHDALSDAPYKEIAIALTSRALSDDELAATLQDGVSQLDTGNSRLWLMRDEAQQVAAVKQLEGSRFFRLVRTSTIEHLYRNREVWQMLGYQGSSVEFGGYIDRGFDDIDWLPGENKAQ
jgi:hypothetical protein